MDPRTFLDFRSGQMDSGRRHRWAYGSPAAATKRCDAGRSLSGRRTVAAPTRLTSQSRKQEEIFDKIWSKGFQGLKPSLGIHNTSRSPAICIEPLAALRLMTDRHLTDASAVRTFAPAVGAKGRHFVCEQTRSKSRRQHQQENLARHVPASAANGAMYSKYWPIPANSV
jgi:hypothetical protein